MSDDDPLEPEAVLSLVRQIEDRDAKINMLRGVVADWHKLADERSAEIVRLNDERAQMRDEHYELLTLRGEKALLLRRLAHRNRVIRVMGGVDFDAPEDTRNPWALLQLTRLLAMGADNEARHYAHQLRQLWRRCKEAERDNVHLRSWLYRIGNRLGIERAVSRHWLRKAEQHADGERMIFAKLLLQIVKFDRLCATMFSKDEQWHRRQAGWRDSSDRCLALVEKQRGEAQDKLAAVRSSVRAWRGGRSPAELAMFEIEELLDRAQPDAPEPSAKPMPDPAGHIYTDTRPDLAECEARLHEQWSMRQTLIRRLESADAQLAAVRGVVDHLRDVTAAARRNREPQTGMQVPYQGEFCSATPSVVRDLERFVRAFEEALRR